MIDMTKPSHTVTPDDVMAMKDSEWLKLVGELAYPQRAGTMMEAVQLAKDRGVKRIVETGCIRGWAGDGQSTLILAMLSARLGCECFSFDINPVHLEKAESWLGSFTSRVRFYEQDSVFGLSAFDERIDFAYLDSFDYDAKNPRPCQLHQLAEVGAIYGKLTDNAIIMMDDANLDGGGKVAMAVDFLKGNGWKVIANSYQIILSKL